MVNMAINFWQLIFYALTGGGDKIANQEVLGKRSGTGRYIEV